MKYDEIWMKYGWNMDEYGGVGYTYATFRKIQQP